VLSVLAMGDGLTFVQMRETAPLDPILSFNFDAAPKACLAVPCLPWALPYRNEHFAIISCKCFTVMLSDAVFHNILSLRANAEFGARAT
jgi:hypothetical protein